METQIHVREATPEDCKEIWEWWNDPLTRRMMRKNDPVPWDEHCAWFEAVLRDTNRILCVGIHGQEKLGVVRFDRRQEFEYEVSINLNPTQRGKGYAPLILLKSMDYLLGKKKVNKIWAGCKKINAPSRKTFERAGFSFKPNSNYEPFGEIYCELLPTDSNWPEILPS